VANFTFTVAAGRGVRYCDLALGTDRLVVVLLQTSGYQGDATVRNYTNLASVLNGVNLEATFTNYARKIVTSGITITPNTTTHANTVSIANLSWLAAGGALNNTVSKLLICYQSTSGATDAQTVPLYNCDVSATTTGQDYNVTISSGVAVATAS
jgi:hypothetical protein